MKNKVLYFPHINVPNSMWLTRMLLYWDEVGAIIPYDYIEDPYKLNDHTRSLIKALLIKQVIPGSYIWKIPSFKKSFINYLESLGKDKLKNRRKSFKHGSHSRIHIEKMNELELAFNDMDLAKREKRHSPWWNVENETAREFMAYLAATLGKLEDLQYAPITDEIIHLEHFLYASSSDTSSEEIVSSLRLQILEDIFPAPDTPLQASEISEFKGKHGDKLSRFRRRVERDIIDIADISDSELRKKRLELFKEESKEAIEEIKKEMSKFGFKQLKLGKLGSIISSIPGVSPLFGLANAVCNAFEKDEFSKVDPAFLYAAYAQKEILKV